MVPAKLIVRGLALCERAVSKVRMPTGKKDRGAGVAKERRES